ncbi:SET domain-containing protein 3 [Rhodotorula toruloides]
MPILASAQEQPHYAGSGGAQEVGDIARAVMGFQGVGTVTAGGQGRQRVPSSSGTTGLFAQKLQPSTTQAALLPPLPSTAVSLPPLSATPLAVQTAAPSHGHGTRRQAREQRAQEQQQQALKFYTTSTGSAQLAPIAAQAATALPSLPTLPLPTLPPLPGHSVASTLAAAPAPRPPPPPYAVPPESGLIRCVCPYTIDDGFTIQCDICNVWQHAACVGIPSPADVPEEYRCERCDPIGARERGVDGRLAEVGMRVRIREMERVQEQIRRAEVLQAQQHKEKAEREAREESQRVMAVERARMVAAQMADVDAGHEPLATPKQRPRATKPRRSGGSTVVAPMQVDEASTEPGETEPPVETAAVPAPAEPTSTGAAEGLLPSTSLPAPREPTPPPPASASVVPTRSVSVEEDAASPAPSPFAPPKPPVAIGRKRRVAKQPKGRATASTGDGAQGDDSGTYAGQATEPSDGGLRLSSLRERDRSGRHASMSASAAEGSAASSSEDERPQTATSSRAERLERMDRSERAAEDDRYESWRYEFTPIGSNLFPDVTVLEHLDEILSAPPASPLDEIDGETQPVLQGLRERQDATRGTAAGRTGAKVVEALYDLQPAYVSMPSLPPHQPVVVKPLSQAATSLSAPPIQSAYIPSPYSSSLHASSAAAQALCPYPRPTTYGLFASASITAGSFILPYRGEVVDLEAYRANPINQYELLGAPKGAVRALPHPWSVVVDARTWGNEARFARSGCRPNAVLRVVKVDGGSGNGARRGAKRSGSPRSRSRSTTPFFSSQPHPPNPTSSKPQWLAQHPDRPVTATFQLAVFAITDIPKRGEIVLPWDWDDGHLVHLLPSLLTLPSPLPTASLLPLLASHPEAAARLSRSMALVTDALLAPSSSSLGGGCACDRKRDCALWWLARAGAASCFSLTAKGGGGRSTDEVAEAFLNSFAIGRDKENMGFGTETHGKKKGGGVQARPVDLGALIGLERGWIVNEPAAHSQAADAVGVDELEAVPQPGDATSDDDAHDDDFEKNAMDVDEANSDLERDGLRASDHTHLGISPSSALTSLPSLPSADASSPVVRPAKGRRRSRRDSRVASGSDTDNSDLTEPLSNLSAQEDDQDEDEDDLSEPDESVLSPPLPSRLQVLARSPSPPLKKGAGKPSKKKRQDLQDSDSPLSDLDDASPARAERKMQTTPAKKKRKTARVYSSSSSSSSGEDQTRHAKETFKTKQDGGSSVSDLTSQTAEGAQVDGTGSSGRPTATASRAKPKIEVKVVTKTVTVPSQGSTTKKRPQVDAPGSLASLKIRKLKDKKTKPRIQDMSDEEDAEAASPVVASPTTANNFAQLRSTSEVVEHADDAVPARRILESGVSTAEGPSTLNASIAPALKDPTSPPPEPPKPAPAPARLSLAAYRQRQMQARVPPPPPPPLASVSMAPPTPSTTAPAVSSQNPLVGVSPAQLEALASVFAASSSPASLEATLAPITPSPATFALSLPSETPPLRPVAMPPPPLPPQTPLPTTQLVATSAPSFAETTLRAATTRDVAESEAGTPPLPPARDLAPAPEPEPLPAARFSAADILKSIGDYFGSSSGSTNSSKRGTPVAQVTSLAAVSSARLETREAEEHASEPSLTAARPAPSSTPPIRPQPLPASDAPSSSLQRLPHALLSLSGAALGLDAGAAAPATASISAPVSGTSAPVPSPSSPMPGFRPISAQSSSAASQSGSAFSRPAASAFPKPRLLSTSPATGFSRSPLPTASTARPTSVSPALVGHAPLYAGSGSRPSPPVRPAELDPSIPTAPKAMQAGLTTPAHPNRSVALPTPGTTASAAGTPSRSGWPGSTPAGRGRGGFHGPRNPNMHSSGGHGTPRGRGGGGWGWRGRGGGRGGSAGRGGGAV